VEESSTAVPGYLPDSEVRRRLALRGRQFRHDNMIRPLAPTPADSVTVTAISGAQRPLGYAELWYTTDGRLPDAVNAHKLPMSQTTVQWEVEAGYMTHWEATIPPQAAGTIVRYRMAGWQGNTAAGDPEVWAHDGHGFWFKVPDPQKGVSVFAYRVETWVEKQPAWLYDAVIYQIFLDRFHPGTADGRFAEGLDPVGKHGGTFKGVMAELPYLAELGINCLWLSPIGPAETYHRYDATDYFNVDPDLGSNEDLKGLIDQAHALGMRVILDFVPSHCSWRHPAFVAAQQDQNASEADWFVFEEWPDKYRTFLNMVPWLVSFNTNSEGARQHLIESAVQWVQDYGFDGLRLDHTIGQGMDFWVAFRAALRAANPEVVTIGEATDTPDALRAYRGRLDDILDFPLAHGLRMTFGRGDWSLSQFDHYLQMHEHYLAEGPERVSFLDNHDMNRFLFMANQDIERLKMAAVVQFTLTPTPTIYYGTE
ncbi:MAG: hypothetical protein KDE51_20960, partial [Anaerolineales bacterium]|nr:hypothetical protein [Anaerolineales bacterium]